MDNYSTHKTALIRNWFAKRPRFHVHFTPTYGSWLSLVERWFAELTMKQIRRGTFRSVPQLKAAIQEFIDAHQADPKPFVWTKSADEILASIARFAQRTVDARARNTTFTNHGYRTLAAAQIAGIRAVLLHAMSDDARRFYTRAGFYECPVDPMMMMITLVEVEKNLIPPSAS